MMEDDMTWTQPKSLTFSARMRLTSLLLSGLWRLLVELLPALWRSGATVSFNLTDPPKDKRVTVKSKSGASVTVRVTAE
jgi:hypothetical protein